MIGHQATFRMLRTVLRLRGSVFPHALQWALPSGLSAAALTLAWSHMGVNSLGIEAGSTLWANFSFILGVLIVFRTNQAYSRYWEGATLLQQVRGEWFNACSSLVAFCSHDEKVAADVQNFQHLLVRLMSMLYCSALQQVAVIPEDQFEIIDIAGMEPAKLEFLTSSKDRCEILMQWIQRLVVDGSTNGVVTIPPPILSRVFQELSRGIVNVTNVRKISEIPFPFPYTQILTSMLILQTVLTPIFASTELIGAPIQAGLLTFLAVFSQWGMNYVAEEIEQPFGDDENDLPIPLMLKEMNDSLRLLLDWRTQTPPLFTFVEERDLHCTAIPCDEAKMEVIQRRIVKGFAKDRTKSFSRRHRPSRCARNTSDPDTYSRRVPDERNPSWEDVFADSHGNASAASGIPSYASSLCQYTSQESPPPPYRSPPAEIRIDFEMRDRKATEYPATRQTMARRVISAPAKISLSQWATNKAATGNIASAPTSPSSQRCTPSFAMGVGSVPVANHPCVENDASVTQHGRVELDGRTATESIQQPLYNSVCTVAI